MSIEILKDKIQKSLATLADDNLRDCLADIFDKLLKNNQDKLDEIRREVVSGINSVKNELQTSGDEYVIHQGYCRAGEKLPDRVVTMSRVPRYTAKPNNVFSFIHEIETNNPEEPFEQKLPRLAIPLMVCDESAIASIAENIRIKTSAQYRLELVKTDLGQLSSDLNRYELIFERNRIKWVKPFLPYTDLLYHLEIEFINHDPRVELEVDFGTLNSAKLIPLPTVFWNLRFIETDSLRGKFITIQDRELIEVIINH
jgi:hypothetical protein